MIFIGLALLVSGLRPAGAEFVGAYNFPFVDPLVASVVKTPKAYQVPDLPELQSGVNSRRGTLAIEDPDSIPPVFFYDQPGLNYGYVFQDGPAPLIVTIAGTGGGFNSGTQVEVARVLHHGGYHVLAIASPTFGNFITTALESHVPGRLKDDARAIYETVQKLLLIIEQQIEFDEVHLAGYSLGGIHAAFVAELDSREQAVGFDKILVMNPPVNLFNSISILDEMLDRNVERNVEAYNELVENIFSEFARFYSRADALDLSSDFLYQFFKFTEPTQAQLEISVGLSFRLSVANLAFVSDVMTESGYLVAKDTELTPTSSLTPYFREAMLRSFEDFFDGLYMPFFQRRIPGLTREQAIEEASLTAIEDFLRNAENVWLLTNEDDIILGPGEIDYLADVFAGRFWIFPTGGHCGNFLQYQVAETINGFFAQ
ncbi:MAG: alpha/beta hydrolase [Planctomycetota bacterium]